jgi:DNA helicase-2/ATP-dependent DNA helicase PcrA
MRSVYRMNRQWSEQQKVIFSWFETGTGNLVVRARAGTGKTTTILEGVSRAICENAVLCSFNTRIAKELNSRLKKPKSGRAEAKTLHGIGFSCIRQSLGKCTVDENRGRKIATKVGTPRSKVEQVVKLAAQVKQVLLPGHTTNDMANLALAFGLDIDSEILGCAQDALAESIKPDGTCDFDDMVYMPLALNMARPIYDLVLVDEAQDMNPVQIELAKRIARPEGRIAVVGDNRQAIYGFRGADSGSIDRLLGELQAQELPLTVTYRCGRAIVDAASRLVPDFEASETVGEGYIYYGSPETAVSESRAGDFILSRTNAPLVPICLKIIREGRKVRIKGNGMVSRLKRMIAKAASQKPGPVTTIAKLLPRLDAQRGYRASRIALSDASEKVKKESLATLRDEYDTLSELADGLSTVSELSSRIETLLTESVGPEAINCSTVHGAKGLEADNVFLLNGTFRFEGPEEDNIKYVAITRAKNTLVYCE